ncbi:hypothetical protein NQ315_010692 [Exocentrus adspersus]|uniref:Superoxide dismutase [Cu-Zn] n=1 Tax=Exocentrus adspersus TaxID=1586481 RepID=A0AAV8VVV1_9CUCU|nr:hypothetical protein NQ315_010692 [Exocentrus adspersus]
MYMRDIEPLCKTDNLHLLGQGLLFKQATVYVDDPAGASGVTGNITFTKTDSGVTVSGTVSGLKEGKHGFHIHALGDLSGGCTSTGGHFNPTNLTHGSPDDKNRHIGDLGNIVADASGVAKIEISDTLIDLEGENSIIGRGVVVHEGEDDLGKGGYEDSLTTGHAGGRLACGVVGILA